VVELVCASDKTRCSVQYITCVYDVCCVQIDDDSEYIRKCTGKLLKDALVSYESLQTQSDLVMQLKYYVRLPDPMTHINHVLQEVTCSLPLLVFAKPSI